MPGTTSAPNPKFAHTVWQVRSRTSGSRGALESRVASGPQIPKFVSERAASTGELRNRTTSPPLGSLGLLGDGVLESWIGAVGVVLEDLLLVGGREVRRVV